MKTSTFLCVALTLASASFAAGAAGATELVPSQQYNTCMEKYDSTTIGMVDCAVAENKRQDGRLNIAYKALMAELPSARKTQLFEAQRAWIKFRDANCGFYLDPEGGTIARVNANLCFMTTTTHRAVELEQFKQ